MSEHNQTAISSSCKLFLLNPLLLKAENSDLKLELGSHTNQVNNPLHRVEEQAWTSIPTMYSKETREVDTPCKRTIHTTCSTLSLAHAQRRGQEEKSCTNWFSNPSDTFKCKTPYTNLAPGLPEFSYFFILFPASPPPTPSYLLLYIGSDLKLFADLLPSTITHANSHAFPLNFRSKLIYTGCTVKLLQKAGVNRFSLIHSSASGDF